MPIEFTPNPQQLTGLDFVVCHRVKDVPIPRKEAHIVLCCECSERMWRANDSPLGAPTICLQCMTEKVGATGDARMVLGPNITASIFRGDTHPDVKRLIDLAMKKDKK